MRKRLFTLSFMLLASVSLLVGQNKPIEKANYQLASGFSPKKVGKMVYSTNVDPHWLKNSERFWYSFETPSGKNYYIVDPAAKSKKILFDNVSMAAQMSMITKDPFDTTHADNIRKAADILATVLQNIQKAKYPSLFDEVEELKTLDNVRIKYLGKKIILLVMSYQLTYLNYMILK